MASAIESVSVALNRAEVRYLVVGLFVAEPLDFDAAYARAVRVTLDTTMATLRRWQGAARGEHLRVREAAGSSPGKSR